MGEVPVWTVEEVPLTMARMILEYGPLGILTILGWGVAFLLWRRLNKQQAEFTSLVRENHEVMQTNNATMVALKTLIEARVR